MPRKSPSEHNETDDRRSLDNESINCCQLDVHKALIRERNSSKYETTTVDLFSKRSCTDILCLFVFLVAVIGWIVLSVFVYINGGPERLLAPVDSNNKRCGFDKGVENRPYLFYFDISKCLPPRGNFLLCDTKQICVSECPKSDFSISNIRNYPLGHVRDSLICTEDFDKYSGIRSYEDVKDAVRRGLCAGWYSESEPVARLCFPRHFSSAFTYGRAGPAQPQGVRSSARVVETKSVVRKIIRSGMYEVDANKGFLQRVGEDLVKSWRAIVAFLCLGMVISFIFVIIMRWIAGIMVWLSIIALLALLVFSSVYTWKNYNKAKEQNLVLRSPNVMLFARYRAEAKVLEDDLLKHEYTWLALFIISVVALVIILIILLFLRSRIQLAIQLIKEGSKAVSYAWTSLIFPAFPWVLQLAVLVHSAFIFCYFIGERVPIYRVDGLNTSDCVCDNGYKEGAICSMEIFNQKCHDNFGGPCLTARCSFSASEAESFTIYLHLYNLLMLLWCEYFILGFSQMSLAMAFCTYFWMKKKKLPFFVMGWSVMRVIGYHLGTIAFGSLLLALLNWIRILVELFYRYINKNENAVLKCLKCCCGWFLACLHKILRIVTKNAYIMCAMKGTNYCTSAKHAFSLIVQNVIRASVLDGVTTFLFFLIKLLITGSMGVMAYYFFSSPIPDLKKLTNDDYEFDYYFVPILVICLATFLISSLFFGVYSSAVDTIFLCALEDLDKNNGTPEKPYVMSKNLIKIFNVKNRRASANS